MKDDVKEIKHAPDSTLCTVMHRHDRGIVNMTCRTVLHAVFCCCNGYSDFVEERWHTVDQRVKYVTESIHILSFRQVNTIPRNLLQKGGADIRPCAREKERERERGRASSFPGLNR